MVQSRMKYFIKEKAQFLGLFHIRSFKRESYAILSKKIAKLMQSIIMVDFPFLVFTVVFTNLLPKKACY